MKESFSFTLLDNYTYKEDILDFLDKEYGVKVDKNCEVFDYLSAVGRFVRKKLGVSDVYPIYAYWVGIDFYLNILEKSKFIRISAIISGKVLVCSLRPSLCTFNKSKYRERGVNILYER